MTWEGYIVLAIWLLLLLAFLLILVGLICSMVLLIVAPLFGIRHIRIEIEERRKNP